MIDFRYPFDVPEHYTDTIPRELINGLRRYVEDRLRTGGFLEAVLRNDLREAIKRADPWSWKALPQIVDLLLESAPAPSWGTPERVEAWLAKRGDSDGDETR